jgi:hypothetical protein
VIKTKQNKQKPWKQKKIHRLSTFPSGKFFYYYEMQMDKMAITADYHSRKPAEAMNQHREQQPFKFDLADLPQDLSVHRSHFSALAGINPTPAHGGAGFSGNGNGVGRSALSPLPVQAHMQSPFIPLHHRSGGVTPTSKNPWPKDEIQVRQISIGLPSKQRQDNTTTYAHFSLFLLSSR